MKIDIMEKIINSDKQSDYEVVLNRINEYDKLPEDHKRFLEEYNFDYEVYSLYNSDLLSDVDISTKDRLFTYYKNNGFNPIIFNLLKNDKLYFSYNADQIIEIFGKIKNADNTTNYSVDYLINTILFDESFIHVRTYEERLKLLECINSDYKDYVSIVITDSNILKYRTCDEQILIINTLYKYCYNYSFKKEMLNIALDESILQKCSCEEQLVIMDNKYNELKRNYLESRQNSIYGLKAYIDIIKKDEGLDYDIELNPKKFYIKKK